MAFLNRLKEILAIDNSRQFSHMCGKREQNISSYLTGNRNPGPRVLEDCLLNATISRVFIEPPTEDTPLGKKIGKVRDLAISNLIGQEIIPLIEVEKIPERQRDLPDSGGIYVLYDSAGNVLYIGQASSFKAEVWQTLTQRNTSVGMRFGPSMKKIRPLIKDLATYMSLYQINNPRLRHNIEALLIRVFINQTHNSNIGKFRTG